MTLKAITMINFVIINFLLIFIYCVMPHPFKNIFLFVAHNKKRWKKIEWINCWVIFGVMMMIMDIHVVEYTCMIFVSNKSPLDDKFSFLMMKSSLYCKKLLSYIKRASGGDKRVEWQQSNDHKDWFIGYTMVLFLYTSLLSHPDLY